MSLRSNIVSVDWLNEYREHEDVVILDATMKKTPAGDSIPSPSAYILGALEFNFDTDICDQSSDLPHMLPSPSKFEAAVQALGISKKSQIICYDAMGIFSSPRAWWMFKVMGHNQVAVLNGGLPSWLDKGFATASKLAKSPLKGDFKAKFIGEAVYDKERLQSALSESRIQLIDARSQARFEGVEPEPRAELRRGHIPGASCLPFTTLIENGEIVESEKLIQILTNQIRDDAGELVFSCGSGVTACVLALAADECGYSNIAVYDGSWSEWGRLDSGLPASTE